MRDQTRGLNALDDIKEQSGNNDVYLKILNLASFASIRKFAEEFNAEEEKLHILVNNAGIGGIGKYKTTEGSIEMVFQINYMGHFLLTQILLEKLKSSAPSRIANVSSLAHNDGTINFEDLNNKASYTRRYTNRNTFWLLYLTRIHNICARDL